MRMLMKEKNHPGDPVRLECRPSSIKKHHLMINSLRFQKALPDIFFSIFIGMKAETTD